MVNLTEINKIAPKQKRIEKKSWKTWKWIWNQFFVHTNINIIQSIFHSLMSKYSPSLVDCFLLFVCWFHSVPIRCSISGLIMSFKLRNRCWCAVVNRTHLISSQWNYKQCSFFEMQLIIPFQLCNMNDIIALIQLTFNEHA